MKPISDKEHLLAETDDAGLVLAVGPLVALGGEVGGAHARDEGREAGVGEDLAGRRLDVAELLGDRAEHRDSFQHLYVRRRILNEENNKRLTLFRVKQRR